MPTSCLKSPDPAASSARVRRGGVGFGAALVGLVSALLLTFSPLDAAAQACCSGATALGTARLAPHEDAAAGVSTRFFSLYGSMARDGSYIPAPDGVVELGFEQSLLGTIRILKKGQLTFVLPFVETYRKVPGVGDVGGGLGDIQLGARVDFLEPGVSATWPGVAVGFGLTLPTGRSPEDAESRLAADATGTGGAAANVDVLVEQGVGNFFGQVAGSALWRAPRVVGDLRPQRGLALGLSLAGGYAWNKVVAAVSFQYRAELAGRLDGAVVEGSGHDLSRAGVSLGFTPSFDWRLQAGLFVDIPVAPLSTNQPVATGLSLTLLRTAW